MAFADGIGPNKDVYKPSKFALNKVDMARSRGFYIHPYTFRMDQGIEEEFHNDFMDELVSPVGVFMIYIF